MEKPRSDQNEFVARALASRDRASLTGKYISGSTVIRELKEKLDQARQRLES